MKRILAALVIAAFGCCGSAMAQTGPNWSYGFVPTPAQWQAQWQSKQDYLGAPPLLTTGGTMTGELFTATPTTAAAGLNLPPGTAPTSPNNGDIWTTSSGVYAQVNGSTVGPFASSATNPCTSTPSSLQYDNAGALGCVSGATSNGTALTVASGDLIFSGSSSGSSTLNAPATGGGTVALPAGSTTLAGLGTVQTFSAANTFSSTLNVSGTFEIGGTSVALPISLANGGTAASLTASNGGIVYSTASAFAVLGGTVTAGQCLLSGSTAAPTWGSCSGAAAVSSVANSDSTLTISPTTGSVVASLNLSHANTWAAAQTFDNGDFKLAGSSSGAMTLEAPAAASTYVMTFPATTDTVAVLGTAQTFSATETFSSTLLVTGTFTATGLVTLGDLATQAANTILVNASSGSASPTAQSAPSCSASNDALNWTTNTGLGCITSLASLTGADQTLSGGANVTDYSLGTVSSGTETIDCGKNPHQYLINGGAFTLAVPTNSGDCLVQVTNNGSAGAITFSGFTVNASYTGATPDTTSGHIFNIYITRLNGSTTYFVVPLQ